MIYTGTNSRSNILYANIVEVGNIIKRKLTRSKL